MSDHARKPSIILVHGAWADGSSWAKIIVDLTIRGYDVVAAPLPLSSLTDDTRALGRVIERISGPVVLVGHAYAGAVISNIDHDQVVALVFIAGLAPDACESVGDVFFRNPPHPNAPTLSPDDDGRFWLSNDAFRNAFAQDADENMLAVLSAVQRPIHAAAIQETLGQPSWKKRPSWYLVAQGDRMISPATQRFVGERMGAVIHETEADHCSMITSPDDVVSIIRAAAGSVVPRSDSQ